jgi:hypothetical protein
MVTILPDLCFFAGIMSNQARYRWPSHVCEVITEPSAEAFFPTTTLVQPSGRSSALAPFARELLLPPWARTVVLETLREPEMNTKPNEKRK